MKSMLLAFLGSILLLTSATKNNVSEKPTTNPLRTIRITDAGGYLTNGTLEVVSFVSNNGSLWAVCKLRGICDGIEIDENCICHITVDPCDGTPRFDMNATAVGTMSNAKEAHNCCVEIRFGPCTVRIATGRSLDLNPHNEQCSDRDFDDDLLCAIDGTPRILTGQLAALLNQLL